MVVNVVSREGAKLDKGIGFASLSGFRGLKPVAVSPLETGSPSVGLTTRRSKRRATTRVRRGSRVNAAGSQSEFGALNSMCLRRMIPVGYVSDFSQLPERGRFNAQGPDGSVPYRLHLVCS